MALRRRLDGVDDVSISQSQQTVSVSFALNAPAFSPRAFREAIREADVEVVRLEIDACGVVEDESGRRWITTGAQRFVLRGQAAGAGLACVTGQLDDGVEPHELDVTNVRRAQ